MKRELPDVEFRPVSSPSKVRPRILQQKQLLTLVFPEDTRVLRPATHSKRTKEDNLFKYKNTYKVEVKQKQNRTKLSPIIKPDLNNVGFLHY